MIFPLAIALAAWWAFLSIRMGFEVDVIGFDFEGTLWDPAIAILDGRSPYPAPVLAEVDVGNPALYPPLLMLVVAPLTALPWWLALAVWTALLAGAVALTLYFLDVRDPRCYLVALIGPFTIIGLLVGNVALLLVPLVALAWRWRDQWPRVGIVLGVAIAAKLFLWPLLFWLLGTRRYRAFGAAVLTTLAAVLIPWAVIGFDGISSYPDLLRLSEQLYAVHSISVPTVLSALGADPHLATRVALALGLAIAGVALYAGRRGGEVASMSIAVLAAVLGSPIVWPFYYALFLIPVAIARPRFSGLWVALLLFSVADRLPYEMSSSGDLADGTLCCKPEDAHLFVWLFNHSPPRVWPALGYAVVAIALVTYTILVTRRPRPAA